MYTETDIILNFQLTNKNIPDGKWLNETTFRKISRLRELDEFRFSKNPSTISINIEIR